MSRELSASFSRISDFERFAGKKIKAILREPVENSRRWEGTLASCADGLITRDPGVLLGIYVADCGAVFLTDRKSGCAGWPLAAALTPETRNLLDQRRLALMPQGAHLINVARGGLIDTEALVTELRAGRITAALDVTDPLEPLPTDHELRRLPNVLLTPHIAAGGLETRRAIGEVAVGEVERFFKGEPLENVVTREMLATMT